MMVMETRPLNSLAEIAEECKVSEKRVKRWLKMLPPPPIAVEGHGSTKRYFAEYYELQKWRIKAFSPQ